MSRQRDALVAEHVMELTVVDEDDQISCLPYSTDIAAAWEVVRVINKTHDIELISPDEEDSTWYVEIAERLPDRAPRQRACRFGLSSGRASADTAPMAICLAALELKGVDVE